MRWLKHISLAHADQAVALVLETHGAEAYGIWWLILEDIAAPMEPGKMEPIACHSAVKWSQICHCSVRRFTSIAKSLADQHLISMQSTGDRIQIEVRNILKYKDEYSKRSVQSPEQDREQIQIQKQITHTETDTKRETHTETPPCAAAPGKVAPVLAKKTDEIAEWYNNEFYPVFPLHKAREAGLKAACAHLKTAELRTAAMAALEAQLPGLQAREPSKRPYPATWINGKRWLDVVDDAEGYSAAERALVEGRLDPACSKCNSSPCDCFDRHLAKRLWN